MAEWPNEPRFAAYLGRVLTEAGQEAAAYPYSDAERATIESLRRKALVGTADQVAARINELGQRFDLDEIVIVTWTHDPAPRRRSYELLAEVFGLA